MFCLLLNFFTRLPFPVEWRSLRDNDLCSITGISDCIFVHNGGHLGVNRTREGAIEMARAVIKSSNGDEENLPSMPRGPVKYSRGCKLAFQVRSRKL
ncbi:unnamed protein product [Trichobilharzia regenti]|nr:unnamed protein product [Trichobilharzia regenti]